MNCCACDHPIEPTARFCGQCGESMRPLDGRYRLDRKLAAGAFGTIYAATCVDTGDAIAIKLLHPDLARTEALAMRFRREGATLASLRHPHTIRTFEHGETDDGTLYIAMELLHGESLRQRFEAQGPLPWRRAVAIIRAAALALAEAHRRGIVHRDLTPSNIFLEQRSTGDYVKVLDFGVAGIVRGESSNAIGERLTRFGEVIGTLAYLSPEQSVGQPCDARSDLYSLGVVAYELVTGRRPFADAATPLALITALHTEDPAAPSSLRPGLPRDLDRVLLACLARDPDARPPSAGALVDALDDLAGTPLPEIVSQPVIARGSASAISLDGTTTQPLALAPRSISSARTVARLDALPPPVRVAMLPGVTTMPGIGAKTARELPSPPVTALGSGTTRAPRGTEPPHPGTALHADARPTKAASEHEPRLCVDCAHHHGAGPRDSQLVTIVPAPAVPARRRVPLGVWIAFFVTGLALLGIGVGGAIATM